jgi:hypothetical protein
MRSAPFLSGEQSSVEPHPAPHSGIMGSLVITLFGVLAHPDCFAGGMFQEALRPVIWLFHFWGE